MFINNYSIFCDIRAPVWFIVCLDIEHYVHKNNKKSKYFMNFVYAEKALEMEACFAY